MAALPLIREFRKADPTRAGLRWAIGSALSDVADDSVYEDIVDIATDASNGRARQMVVVALGKMKNPAAVDVLSRLLDDHEVAGHALLALRDARRPDIRAKVERLLTDDRAWVRKEAAKVLKRTAA